MLDNPFIGLDLGGERIKYLIPNDRAHDTNLMATLRRSIGQSEAGRYIRELCLPASPLTVAGPTLYGSSYRVGKSNPKCLARANWSRDNREPHPPCNMARSVRRSSRGNCLHGIALPSLAQAPVEAARLALVEIAAGRAAIGPERAVERARALAPLVGLGERSEPSARLRGPWRGHGRATRPSWKAVRASCVILGPRCRGRPGVARPVSGLRRPSCGKRQANGKCHQGNNSHENAVRDDVRAGSSRDHQPGPGMKFRTLRRALIATRFRRARRRSSGPELALFENGPTGML